MAEKDENDDNTEDLVMVGEGVEEGDQKPAAQDDKPEDLAAVGEGAGDARVGAGEAIDEEAEKKVARAAENKSRRQRQKDAKARDRTELKFLRSRNEQVERQLGVLTKRVDATETATVEQRISQIDGAISNADSVYAAAIDANEGKNAAEANRIRDGLKEQKTKLEAYRDAGGSAEVDDDAPDPVMIGLVKDWHGNNKWFDFRRGDEDSAIAGAIDDMMMRDGYDPSTPEYYEVLQKKIDKRLPHLAKKVDDAEDTDDDEIDPDNKSDKNGAGDGKPSGGPKFRVGGVERSLKPGEVHINKERREAMEEAGVWEDKVLRKKFLARYAAWDKENPSV